MAGASSNPIPRHRAGVLALVTVSLMAMSTDHALSASAPCHIVDSYYPKRLCRESDDPTECRVAPNSFGTRALCCDHFGSDGCTPDEDEVQCFVAGSRYPTTACIATNDPEICHLKHSNWLTMEACCEKGAAFTHGCDWQYTSDFSAEDVAESCWIASTYYPVRECYEITDGGTCQRGWGSWRSYQECCEPNAAHADGCGFST